MPRSQPEAHWSCCKFPIMIYRQKYTPDSLLKNCQFSCYKMSAQTWVSGFLRVGSCWFNRSSSCRLTWSGVLSQLRREHGLKGCCFTQPHRVYSTAQILSKNKPRRTPPKTRLHESVLSSPAEERQLNMMPSLGEHRTEVPFRNCSAHGKRSWLKANTYACPAAFLDFGSLICWRPCLILSFCWALSF